jgi:hypothetical protein
MKNKEQEECNNWINQFSQPKIDTILICIKKTTEYYSFAVLSFPDKSIKETPVMPFILLNYIRIVFPN